MNDLGTAFPCRTLAAQPGGLSLAALGGAASGLLRQTRRAAGFGLRNVGRQDLSPPPLPRAHCCATKGRLRSHRVALLSLLVFLALPGRAQEEEALDKASHDLGLSKIHGLMYLSRMSEKCPFEKKVAREFEFVAIFVAAGIPKLPLEEIEAQLRTAQAQVDKDLLEAKEESCKKAVATVRATVAEVETLLKSKK